MGKTKTKTKTRQRQRQQRQNKGKRWERRRQRQKQDKGKNKTKRQRQQRQSKGKRWERRRQRPKGHKENKDNDTSFDEPHIPPGRSSKSAFRRLLAKTIFYDAFVIYIFLTLSIFFMTSFLCCYLVLSCLVVRLPLPSRFVLSWSCFVSCDVL